MKIDPSYTKVIVSHWPATSTTPDPVVTEEPLEVRVEGETLLVTMRTPGEDRVLVTGLLFAEGIIESADDIRALEAVGDPSQRNNTIDVLLAGGVMEHRIRVEMAARSITTTSACGVCGTKSIERLLTNGRALESMATVDPETLFAALENLKTAQPVFRATGGAHAAALVQSGGDLLEVYEDVGRHNAIDKTIGAALLSGRESFSDLVLLTTGRAAFETLQKAYMAGISIVAAVGPASSLAVALGREANIAVVGFLKPDGFNRYL